LIEKYNYRQFGDALNYLNQSKTPHYPSRLLDLFDAPKEIYCLGNIKALKIPSIAIVGSRKASNHGLQYARFLLGH